MSTMIETKIIFLIIICCDIMFKQTFYFLILVIVNICIIPCVITFSEKIKLIIYPFTNSYDFALVCIGLKCLFFNVIYYLLIKLYYVLFVKKRAL